VKLTPENVIDQKLILQAPKSGREAEIVFIPQRIADRLQKYIRDKSIKPGDRIFTITYAAARLVVKKAGKLAGTELRPHDLRRHAATYASRSGVPIEIVSKVEPDIDTGGTKIPRRKLAFLRINIRSERGEHCVHCFFQVGGEMCEGSI
jgi:hypothetical protein